MAGVERSEAELRDMHGSLPPIIISGPDQPHAFDGIPIDRRPDHRSSTCATCKGHGAWNVLLHQDTGRCVIQACDDCDGSGWTSDPDKRVVDEIVYDERGRPRWALVLRPRPVKTREPLMEAKNAAEKETSSTC
jgi:hypothetical protein